MSESKARTEDLADGHTSWVPDVPVRSDPALDPVEKGLNLVTTKADEAFHVQSEVASVSRYLINHPAISVTQCRIRNREIVAVWADVPRSLVSFGAKPRKSTTFGAMLSSGDLRERE